MTMSERAKRLRIAFEHLSASAVCAEDAADLKRRLKEIDGPYGKDYPSDAQQVLTLGRELRFFVDFSSCEEDAGAVEKILAELSTVAQRLDRAGENGEKYCEKAGGVRSGDGRSEESPLYTFPDGSAAWTCPRCGVFFDWGWGCCLPD